ncbi:hypothetical protein GCM10011325_37150 [Dyadobacter sediminis]|nr:hypothetical protein GCM10011325_37150 [Dyadobacter sediminis]
MLLPPFDNASWLQAKWRTVIHEVLVNFGSTKVYIKLPLIIMNNFKNSNSFKPDTDCLFGNVFIRRCSGDNANANAKTFHLGVVEQY